MILKEFILGDSMKVKIYDRRLPQEAKYIRETVFVKEQGFNEEFDTTDNISTHLVVFDGEIPVGTCRYYKDSNNIYYIGRLAIMKNYRGKGIGAFILHSAENSIKSRNGKTIRLHSQYRAKEFYEKQGYKSYGEPDYDEDCLHIWMEKTL